MSYFQRLAKYFPGPFKFIQKKLDIESQWVQFKTNLRPHRYKIGIITLIITYPLYQSYLQRLTEHTKKYISKNFEHSLQPQAPAFQWTQNFIKHLLDHIFSDPLIKQQALTFLFKLVKDEEFVNQILQLIVSALKSQPFMTQLKAAVSQILVDQIQRPEVKSSINQLLEGIATNQKIKTAFIQLITDVFSSQESVSTIVSLLKKGVTNEEVKQALAESINFAVREVLADEETLNQLKIFIFFLLRKFENDDEIKGMMDILFAKGLGLVKKKRDPDLQKLLRNKKIDNIV